MHPELVQIAATAEFDRQIAALCSQIERHKASLLAAAKDVEVLVDAVQLIDGELKQDRQEETRLNTDIAKLQRRKASATRVIEGLVPAADPEAAQRQIEQCDALLDERETEVLELLDLLDAKIAERTKLRESLGYKEKAYASEKQAIPEKISQLEDQKRDLSSKREEVFQGLPSEVQRRYTDIARRRGSATARIINNACAACHFTIAAQHRSDLGRGLVVPCKSCSRWLILDE